MPSALMGCGAQPIPKPGTTSTSTPYSTAASHGERIPELQAWYQSANAWQTEFWRKIALDGEKIGLKYRLNGVSNSAWLNAFYTHSFGDLLAHQNDSIPYRDADPSEQVVARVHSREAKPPQRNIGEYKNLEVDRLAEMVETELDPKKRLEAAHKIQDIVALDYYIWASCTGPNPVNAYNSADWDGVVPAPGSGIGGTSYPWNWLSVRSKTGRKRLVYAVNSMDYLALTNPFGPNGVRGTSTLYWDHFVMLDPDFRVVPWVATAWKTIDSLTWELKVRENVKWHDGRPMTAEDVAFTFNYMAKWKPSFYDVVWSAVEAAEVVNSQTVRLKTRRPAANMTTDLLIRAALVPKHIWENLVERQNVKDPSAVNISPEMIVGTGPFKFGHLTPDVELLLGANKDHWMAPKFDEFLQVLVPNLDVTLGRLESKEVDFEQDFLTPSQADRLKTQKHISIVEGVRTLNPFIVTFVDRLPWRDPLFRRAWHRTVDKSYLVDVLWEGAGKVLPFSTLMAEKHPFHNPAIKERFNYDPDEARKILAGGGYSWDKEGRLLYPGADNADYRKRAEQVLAPV